jgi:hypothetical protein
MRAHRFEPLSLIFGLLFAGIGLTALQGDIDLWRLNWDWFWPVALTAAGLAILLSARPRRHHEDVPAADE